MQPFEPQRLPIRDLDWVPLISVLGRANRAVSAFGGLLYNHPSPDVLLSPMMNQEAVLSSRIEGTQAELEDVLRFEAGEEVLEETTRRDIQEIINYRHALRRAQELLRSRPFCINTLLEIHGILMDSVRGFNKAKGRFRTTQNWIGPPDCSQENAYFVPPRPESLSEHVGEWEKYYHADEPDPLVQLAVVHAQFEILHPFLDGNGRLGRMLVPLFLYEKKLLSGPCFYISEYLESHRDGYYGCLRRLGQPGSWTEWVKFFLEALAVQGEVNTAKARAILDLYDVLKKKAIDTTRSQYAVPVLDYIFQHPVFRGPQVFHAPNMPTRAAVNSILAKLADAGVLRVLSEGAGRRPTLYMQADLIELSTKREQGP